jgi:hypothetical protein
MVIIRQPDPPDESRAIYHLHLSPADLRELGTGGAAHADVLLPISTALDGKAEFVLYGGDTPAGNRAHPEADPHAPARIRAATRSRLHHRPVDDEQRPGRPRQSHHHVTLHTEDLAALVDGQALLLGIHEVDLQNPHYQLTVAVG